MDSETPSEESAQQPESSAEPTEAHRPDDAGTAIFDTHESADGGDVLSGTDSDFSPSEELVAASPRSSWARRGAAAGLALVVVGAAGGVAIGHQVWRPSSRSASSTAGGQTLPTQPGGTSGSTGGSTGTGGTGSTGNGFQPGEGYGFGGNPFGGGSGSTSGGTTSGSGSSSGTGPSASDAAAIAKDVDPGVVDINTSLKYEKARAAGTGMVLTSTGEILTNNHVIDGATSISVTDIGNGKTYSATVVGYDKTHDVAVLQLQGASGLSTITPSTTAATTGAGVVGIGNAEGAGGTPSYAAGSITATNKKITASDASDGTSEQLTGLLETNAGIVSGDSGGPLVNTQGEVVGMDTAASSTNRLGSTSTGFAIPIQTALSIASTIEAGETTSTVHIGTTALLGVEVSTARAAAATSGAVVAAVTKGGPAAGGGITAGDTIVSIAGQKVTTAAGLSSIMLTLAPGTSASVSYLTAQGAEHTTSVKLVAGPPQ